jgi:dihydroorotate dehydrogenase
MNLLRMLCSFSAGRKMLRRLFHPKTGKAKEVFGLQFRNTIGMGAGFDKNAKYLRELEVLGFGFVEIGTVTPRPQSGNPTPRLFRLPKDKALINRMGFNNEGVERVALRLKTYREQLAEGRKNQWPVGSGQWAAQGSVLPDQEQTDLPYSQDQMQTDFPYNQEIYKTEQHRGKDNKKHAAPETANRQLPTANWAGHFLIGGNIGKNKDTPNEEAHKDYSFCFEALHPYVDFFVVNVSSPNTPGLRALQEKDALKKILTELQQINLAKTIQRPILLKIAPDLNDEQLIDVIDLVKEIRLDGVVATNTTISRSGLQTSRIQLNTIGMGGLSGKPVANRSTWVVRFIHERTKGSIPIIGSGGVFTAADAKEKMDAGAALLEVWTGFVYEGPMVVKRMLDREA